LRWIFGQRFTHLSDKLLLVDKIGQYCPTFNLKLIGDL